jgi:hypothetical protein
MAPKRILNVNEFSTFDFFLFSNNIFAMFKSPPISSVQSPGSGSVILSTTPSSQAIFSTLNYSYPLKLLSPSRYFGPNRACLFCLTYVGLLGGDQVNLTIVVEEGAMLVLLTQGTHPSFNKMYSLPHLRIH